MKTFALLLLRFRVPASLAFAGLLAASLVALPRVKLDFSIVPLLEAGEEAKAEVRRFDREVPPRPTHLSVALEHPAPLTRADLARIDEISRRIEELPSVAKVLSLATTRAVELRDGVPVPMPFPATVEGDDVLAAAGRHPLIRDRLISADGRSTALLLLADFAVLRDAGGIDVLLDEVEALLPDVVPDGVRWRLLGGAVVERTMTTTMRRDMLRSVLFEGICFLVLLPLVFRSLRGCLIPMAVVYSAVAMNFGLMVALDLKITIVGVAIPGLVTIIGLCDAVHLMHRFEEAFAETGDKFASIVEAVEKVGAACFHTSLTTGIGFLSLLTADHAAVRGFAVAASLAVLVAFAVVLVFLPLALSFWPVRVARRDRLDDAAHLSYGRRGLTFALFAAGTLVFAAGATRIEVDSSWLEELPRRDPVVENMRWYETNFTGLLTLDARIDGDLASPEAFRAVEALERRMVAENGIRKAESYATWTRELLGNPVAPDGSPAELSDAEIERGIARLKLSGNDFPRHVVARDFGKGRIVFQTGDTGTKRYLELKDVLESEARGLPPSVRAEVAGYTRMAHESSRLVVTTMLESFAISFFAIVGFVTIAMRSVRLGLASIVPNLLPILVALGLNGLLGIRLRIGIVMIYCLGIGLAVDDSIHLIARYRQERADRPGETTADCLRRALRGTGRAMFSSSVVLAVGALCYLPSEFKSLRDVGILLTGIVVSALLCDLYLLPHLIEMLEPKRPTDPRAPVPTEPIEGEEPA